jgi:hypothetical protein
VGGVVRYFKSSNDSCLLELILFLEELKERESPDVESQDEPAQGDHISRQLLDIIEALGQHHFCDSQHHLWVRVDSMTGDHIPK